MHDPRLDRVNVGREMIHEVVLGQPGEALGVHVQVRQRWGRRTLRQQRADRFALIEAEGRDEDQADNVRRIRAQSSDDLTAVRMTGDDRRAVLAGQHLAQPGHISGQRGLGELGRDDLVAVGLQALDDRAPAGAIGPPAVDQDDIRPDTHQWR
jgi:hypothetical protein